MLAAAPMRPLVVGDEVGIEEANVPLLLPGRADQASAIIAAGERVEVRPRRAL